MDLVALTPALTWRRFLVLVRGLSVQSATITALARGEVAPSKRTRTITDSVAAQRAFVSMFGPGPKPRPS